MKKHKYVKPYKLIIIILANIVKYAGKHHNQDMADLILSKNLN